MGNLAAAAGTSFHGAPRAPAPEQGRRQIAIRHMILEDLRSIVVFEDLQESCGPMMNKIR